MVDAAAGAAAVAILAAETMIAVVDDVHSWISVLRNLSHPY